MKVKIIKDLRIKEENKTILYREGREYTVNKDFAEKYADFLEIKAVKKYENKAIKNLEDKSNEV